jgi:hypothetical protein
MFVLCGTQWGELGLRWLGCQPQLTDEIGRMRHYRRPSPIPSLGSAPLGSLSYRSDYEGRSVVLSGDTRISENLIRYARRLNLLVHEVIAPEAIERAGTSAERAKTNASQQRIASGD